MARSSLVLVLAFFGCKAPAVPPSDPVQATRVPTLEPEGEVPSRGEGGAEVAFGGESWGFVMAATANRRFVFVRRFPGEPPENMGHHGDRAMDTALTAFDLVEGTERSLGEVIDLDDAQRFVLVTGPKGETLLLDGEKGTWDTLEASAVGDDNPCLPPRSASFSPSAHFVGFVSPDGRSFVVQELATGDRFAVEPAAGDLVWRGWPHDEDQKVTLAVVPGGSDPPWPLQNTSCACRYCNRFAMSVGYYGWSGPSFDLVEVSPGAAPVTVENVPERQGAWLDEAGPCRLRPTETKAGLERGPWRWVCA